MRRSLTAIATSQIIAPPAEVWRAITDTRQIKEFMFGSEVTTDWQEGSPITYRGEWEGKQFEDKGTVVKVEPEKRLVTTHWSPMSGTPDKPENSHQVTYVLKPVDGGTEVSISQDNNANDEETQHSEEKWGRMLKNLKDLLEK